VSSVKWASWPLALTFMVMHVVAWAVTVVMLTRLATPNAYGESAHVGATEDLSRADGGCRTYRSTKSEASG